MARIFEIMAEAARAGWSTTIRLCVIAAVVAAAAMAVEMVGPQRFM